MVDDRGRPKGGKIEHRIKELNAIRGEYRTEIEEAEAQCKKRKITKEEFETVSGRKCEEKMEHINDKVKECHDELHDAPRVKTIMIVPEPCSISGTLFPTTNETSIYSRHRSCAG